MIVISNNLDMNTIGGESSKYVCDVLEFHYLSTYDGIERAWTYSYFEHGLIHIEKFLTIFS